MMAPTRAILPGALQQPCARGLRLLMLLFAFRVAAQGLQKLAPVPFLPAFEAWQSGTLPYGLLLGLQVLLLIAMTLVQRRVASGAMLPRRKTGEALLSLGSAYFAFMLFRLGAAFTFAQGQPFLGAALPAFFHLVLSGWVIGLGLYHQLGADPAAAAPAPAKTWEQAVPWLAYPLLIALSLWLHLFLLDQGAGLLWSSYVPVAVAALLITGLERRFPVREEWHPDREDVQGDVTFMVLVQILLPKVLAFLLAVTVLRWLHARDLPVQHWWPHDLPPLAQAALMLLLADLLRYWLHRASHEWSPRLWRLHAVHHSPQKLYWVNVGRFHPLEKALQFLFDAAPFLVLGVAEEVLALYFVFYAVNGFIQHCNIRLRLGWLNWVISGPELHRWHHSWDARESNKNYGNNVILWDLLFGSYFCPQDRQVEKLGLRNRNYPRGFLRQLKTPFIKGADQAPP